MMLPPICSERNTLETARPSTSRLSFGNDNGHAALNYRNQQSQFQC